RSDGAVSGAHVAVTHTVYVNVVSDDRPRRVQACEKGNVRALAGACAGAGSVEGGDGAAYRAHEAVKRPIPVNVVSRDGSRRIDVAGQGALAGACARAWSVARGEGP